jgi:hypothetical protein
VPDGPAWQVRFLDYTITPLQGDKLSRLFATIFALMAAGGGLFALGQKSRVEVPAAFVYAGSAIGVALAGDLITVFVFWELMAVGSTLVLWSHGKDTSYRAARRYLMIHLLGGVVLFAGITGHVAADRQRGLHAHGARLHRALADPDRLPRQRRRAAAVGLAARCLPRGLVERHGVPLGLHHQDGGLRADPRLPRAPSC